MSFTEKKHAATGWEYLEKSGDGPTIILFHGYGASQSDLAPLSQVPGMPQNARWIFPNGPKKLALGPFVQGFSWFDIDERALAAAMMEGGWRDFSSAPPEGFVKRADQAKNFIEDFRPTDGAFFFVGGFSQGAMLTTDVVLQLEKSITGLLILSGNLVAEKRWAEFLKVRKEPLKVFQSHGERDEILSPHSAAKLAELLKSHSCDVTYCSFPGGHEIPPLVLEGMMKFLSV